MTRNPVASSNIRSIGYEAGRMHIEFANGRVYEYTGAKVREHFDALMAAPSVGTYFAKSVRGCPDTVCKPLPAASVA